MKNLALSWVFEAGQSSVDAVERDRVPEAALVRPRQVETLLEYLQKSGSHVEPNKQILELGGVFCQDENIDQ